MLDKFRDRCSDGRFMLYIVVLLLAWTGGVVLLNTLGFIECSIGQVIVLSGGLLVYLYLLSPFLLALGVLIIVCTAIAIEDVKDSTEEKPEEDV